MGNKLNKVDPIDPDIVLLGLILVSFFPPINLPLIYPPISENIVNIIIQINKKKEEAVSFLKWSKDNSEITKTTSKKIIVIFLLKTEKASKLARIKIAYKKETM